MKLRFIAALTLSLTLAMITRADPPLPVIPSRTTNVLSFGAYGDGISNNASAINAAITAINALGGGTVEISPGSASLTNYLSGPITMKSSVNLQIVSNALGRAKLQMLPMSSWPNASTPFIFGNTLTDVEISGSGILDGQGTNWWFPLAGTRPNFVQFDKCTRVWIRDVTLQNPPTFTIYLKNGPSVSITVEGIRIDTPYDSHNTDAFDISSTNILIRNSFISTGDDDVELGGSSQAATDITISNCTFGTGHGLSCGSKIGGGVNNVLVSNCWWNGTEYGIKMKSDRGSGGIISSMKYMDLHMTNVNFAIAFYMDYTALGSPSRTISVTPSDAAANAAQTFSSSTPVYRNITINNLEAVGNSGIQGPGNIAVFMYGLPESPITNVTMSNVNIRGRSSDGAVCMYYVKGIQIIDSNLTAPLTGTNVLTLYSAEVTWTNSAANTNLVTMGGLGSPSNSVLAFFNGQAAVVDSKLAGRGTFSLSGSSLTFNPASMSFSNNLNIVSASTVGFGSGVYLHNGVLSGTGSVTFNLPGAATLSLRNNNSSFTGDLVVSNTGTLSVFSNTGSGALTVLSGASLAGNGFIGGPVTVNGTLAPGNLIGTLTISNNLVASGGGILRYELGTTSDRTAVTGNLTLGGTLNITDSGGFTNATYTLFTYGGALTYNGVTIGSVPDTNFSYTISTDTLQQVNLVVAPAASPPLDPFVAWQLQYFNCTNLVDCPQAAGDADPLGKGISNTNQFLVGLNPTNPASVFRITSVVTDVNSNVVITWAAAGPRTNAVQASSGDANGNYSPNFVDITTPPGIIIPDSGDVTTNYLDVGGATNLPSRYYRIRLVP
jgi:polygalacturonase